jgi:hypothetical protein
MYTKRNIIVLTSIALVMLLFTTAWSVFAVADDTAAWSPDLGPRLDGAWVMIAQGPTGAVVHNSFNTAQDSQGLRYTTIVEHTECNASVFGTFPEANAQSLMMGLSEKTSPTTTKATMVHYGLKVGGVQEEVIYIAITSWEAKLVDEDHCTIKATLSFYLPQQDANHDGLPDAGQKPVLCGPYDATLTRVKLMPMCQ